MKTHSAETPILWQTCKTIPTFVLDHSAAEIDPDRLRVQTPPEPPSRRNAHLLIRKCTIGDSDDNPAHGLEYKLKDKIGQGACGLVYAADQNTIDREVAIKVIRPEMADDALIKSLFLSEAVVTGDLDHPNIVPIYDLGIDQEQRLFYTMKKVKGIAWSQVIGSKTEAENIDILLRVCDAIAFSHAKGVIHRDLKPHNVMLGDYGEVFVMDWGVAVSPSGQGKAEALSPLSSQAGTPLYMAPEMVDADASRVNHFSDIYLLGGILYEIETGLTPHRAGSLKECLRKVAGNVIQPTKKTSELIDIALKAMATDPSQRYQDVAEFSQAIRDYQSHAQSITLCQGAADIHARAKASRAYQDYQMALFSYENALLMWPDNPRAAAAKIKVNLDYAGAAFKNKDYDLAISLLDADQGAHRALLGKAVAAKAERQVHQKHIRWLKLASLTLVLVTLAVVTIGFFIVKAQKDLAVSAEHQMRIAQTEALQENYYTAIALAARKLNDQLFSQAQTLLHKLPQNLRGWEWGRLMRLCDLELATFRGHDRSIVAVAFSADERRFVSADRGGTIKLWNLADGQVVGTYSGIAGKIDKVGLSADNRRLWAIHTDGLMFFWDIGSGAMTQAGYETRDDGAYLFYSPDKTRFIKRTLENTALVQTDEGSPPVCRLQGHTGPIYAASFSPDGQRVVTGSADKSAIVWDATSGRPLIRLQGHSDSVQAVHFSPSGRYILTGSADRAVKCWDAQRSRDRIQFIGHGSFVSGVAFSPDNRTLATSSHDGTLKLWNIADQTAIMTLSGHHGRVAAVAFSPDGRLLLSGAADNAAILWRVATGEIVSRLSGHTHSITGVAFSPDGKSAATASWDRTIKLWDLTTFQETATWTGHQDAVVAIQFSPDGSLLASGSKDHTVRLWETATGTTTQVFDGHSAAVYALAFSPDGRRLATASWDKTIKVWDVSTGDLRQTLTGHNGSICAVRYVDNGRRLISTGWDKSIKVWDAQSGQELLELRGPSSPIVALAVSPDDRMIASAGHDNTATLWEAAPYSEKPVAHQRQAIQKQTIQKERHD
ncbi:putative Cyclin-dependent kinase [Desulfosarcina cetonica]|nr:putative Cyclin-dependent kinase [Desulfosarcina cetonica]